MNACWRGIGSALYISLIGLSAVIFVMAQTQDERVTVRVDGRTLFRVGASGDVEARERARRIERRITSLLENPPRPFA
ncbi:MAG: hypothetical protein LC742_11720 [Acidobacteria bacterium]|nr:hypothetical protein [Acidobacteriota bacterium]